VAKISNERDKFSQRLQKLLRESHHSPDRPTELAREFNIRYPGPAITVHAARKWLVGEAIPTQDKMRTLADWLMVPIDWLRFGGDVGRHEVPNPAANASSIDIKLMADMQLLDEEHKQIVREVVRILIRITRSKSDNPA
jgi:hypothetical protein